MARLTKTQITKGAKLWLAADAAWSAVFQGEQHTPFGEAYKTAPSHLRKAYDDATAALRAFERQMVAECRGYIDGRGHFAETGSCGSPWISPALELKRA